MSTTADSMIGNVSSMPSALRAAKLLSNDLASGRGNWGKKVGANKKHKKTKRQGRERRKEDTQQYAFEKREKRKRDKEEKERNTKGNDLASMRGNQGKKLKTE